MESSIGGGALESTREGGELAAASDERRVEAESPPEDIRQELDESVCARCAFDLVGRDLLRFDDALHDGVRRLGEQDLAGPGATLERLRPGDCLPGSELVRIRRHEDLARGDGGAHLEEDAVLRQEAVVQDADRLAQLVRGPDAAERVVLVRRRHAEDPLGRLAPQAAADPSVPLDRRTCRRVVAVEDGAQGLRVEGLRERGCIGRPPRRRS